MTSKQKKYMEAREAFKADPSEENLEAFQKARNAFAKEKLGKLPKPMKVQKGGPSASLKSGEDAKATDVPKKPKKKPAAPKLTNKKPATKKKTTKKKK